MYVFIYLKWEKCPHFGTLRKFSPNGIMQRRKLRRFSFTVSFVPMGIKFTLSVPSGYILVKDISAQHCCKCTS
jgi:hypothetical protein